MKNRIEETFSRLREEKKKALVVFLTGGDPDLERSLLLAEAAAEAGADLLEIGVPFSDPLADGPTIQAASGRALAAGTNIPGLLDLVFRFRKKSEIPLVLFTYLNPIYAYGFEKFHRDAAQAGADGVLILDLPPDEAVRNKELAATHGLSSIQLIAPTTPESRIAEIAAKAKGFLYYVSREGVTGEQTGLSESISERVEMIRRHSTLPVVVGFGISTPDQAAEAAIDADGAVVGSAIVRRIAEWSKDPELIEKVKGFIRPLAGALHAS